MKVYYLTVDGMVSGTGIRDSVIGGYVEPQELNLPEGVINKIREWQLRYAEAHFSGFSDHRVIETLDIEGLEICKCLRAVLPNSKIEYFSSGTMRKYLA